MVEAKTVIVWRGLLVENYIGERDIEAVLSHEITNVINKYLSIVFHRFMERREKSVKYG